MAGPIIWDEKKKVDTKRILIDPITRLEGHGKIEIFLDDSGNVENAYWQVPEVRGLETRSRRRDAQRTSRAPSGR